MRTIVAGSRDITDYVRVSDAMRDCGWAPSVVLSGRARGVDRLGEIWARTHGVPLEIYPANWRLYGNTAGHMRNVQMAINAEALVAVWDGKSKGTGDMISIARRMGLRVFVRTVS